jgi:hypothetical protein
MDLPLFNDYYAPRFSGCSMKYAKLFVGKRQYDNLAECELYELLDIHAITIFDFLWRYQVDEIDKCAIIRNMPLNYPLQYLVVNDQIDPESFISLN